mgnify:CR=1 FL=1
MDDRTLRVLEYEKVIDMLVAHSLSSLGKEMAKHLKPSSDRVEVEDMLAQTSEAETMIVQSEKAVMDTFPDVSDHIKKVNLGVVLSPKELLEIAKLLRTADRVKGVILEFEGDVQIIPNIASCLISHKWLYTELYNCIEDAETISDKASTELGNIRRRIKRAHSNIRDRLDRIIQSPQYQKYLQESIVTIRDGRYVVPVKQESRGNVPGLIHDQSSSGATLFIEPIAVVEANNELRELMLDEKREIERILADLSDKVNAVSDDIIENMNILAQLDFIFARGKLSITQRAVHPTIVDGDKLKIINGRHPMIKEDEVVPISVELGYDFNTLVITGPNTGGKTVTLKTIGLFVLMTQSGLHIPAGYGTEMGIFSSVFADIGDEQSIEQNLSTFSSHMTNIVDILDRADAGSLTLFDELGAGTDPTEGAALAMSILDYLNKNNIKTVATTHYSELKIFAMTRQGMENASMEFDLDTLRPTFKLLIGMPGKSNAFEISSRLGLSDVFIDGAKNFLTQEDIRFEDVIRDIEHDRIVMKKRRREAEREYREVKELREKLNNEKKAFLDRRQDMTQKAKEEAMAITKKAKEEADRIIQRLNSLSNTAYKKKDRRAAEEARKALKEKVDDLEKQTVSARMRSNTLVDPPKNLKLGDTVYITNLDQKGQVLTLPDEDGELQVQVGIMKVTAHISNVRETEEEKPRTPRTYRKKNISIRDRKVNTEVDVRGYGAEEAILEVDRFLDDSFLLGLGEVTIIHGKGTGILRSRIQDHLRTHPHVKAFRLGEYGEGETGVTVVNLK